MFKAQGTLCGNTIFGLFKHNGRAEAESIIHSDRWRGYVMGSDLGCQKHFL
jgi:hypothetical protein